MDSLFSTAFKIAIVSSLFTQTAWSQTCLSFGVDFQSGDSYFQNSLSTDPFTFVSRFEGCSNDVANNLLVDPSGNELQCSDTNLQPDDTPELSICPIEKANLVSGAWSVLIVSNNKNGTPIAYARDFSLVVGPQQTSTYTPTVTLSATTTPVFNYTSTSTLITTTILDPSTATSPSVFSPTTTSTPKPVKTTVTKTLATITETIWSLDITQVVVTSTATCATPSKHRQPDPTCSITPTLITAKALETGAKARHAKDRRVPSDRTQRINERNERVGLVHKRAPDAPTVTVTDINTSDYTTVTSTSTAPATTVTVVSIATVSATSTPPPITVYSGVSTASLVTITAPTPTKTKTKYTIATAYTSAICEEVVTVTTTITPSASLAACTSIGGSMQ